MDTGIDKLGIQLYRLAVVTKGRAPLLLFLCYLAEIEVRCPRFWVYLQHILELDRGLVVVLFFKIGLATLQVLGLAFFRTATTAQHKNKKQRCCN